MRLVTVLLCVLQWTYVNPVSFTRRVSTLAEIPSDIPSNVDYINIGDGLTTISSYAFSQFGSLRKLYLHDNQIVSVDDNAFADILNLQMLYLYNNKMTVIPSFTSTCQNEQFYYLQLNHNQLVDIPSSAFINCTNVRELYLYSNKLTTLYTDSFTDLTALIKLRLYDNLLTVIPSQIFVNCISIMELHLHSNQLTTLYNDSFLGLTAMTHLHLSSNLLTEVPFLPSLPSLTHFSIHHNIISYWNDKAIPSMPKLYLIDAYFNELAYVQPLPYLPTLRILRLYNNKLHSLEFSNNTPSLHIVYLAHNRLDSFPDFTPLASSVQEIYMHQNLITQVNRTDVLHMHGVNNKKVIKINNNPLKEVYAFPCKPNLADIFLIGTKSFKNRSTLQTIT